MEDIELISYLLMFALSVIFSAFAIERKSVVFSFLSFLTWAALAMCHLSLAYTTDFIILAWVFAGLSATFFVYGCALVVVSVRNAANQKRWSVEL